MSKEKLIKPDNAGARLWVCKCEHLWLYSSYHGQEKTGRTQSLCCICMANTPQSREVHLQHCRTPGHNHPEYREEKAL